MANKTISQISLNGTTYDICDITARDPSVFFKVIQCVRPNAVAETDNTHNTSSWGWKRIKYTDVYFDYANATYDYYDGATATTSDSWTWGRKKTMAIIANAGFHGYTNATGTHRWGISFGDTSLNDNSSGVQWLRQNMYDQGINGQLQSSLSYEFFRTPSNSSEYFYGVWYTKTGMCTFFCHRFLLISF